MKNKKIKVGILLLWTISEMYEQYKIDAYLDMSQADKTSLTLGINNLAKIDITTVKELRDANKHDLLKIHQMGRKSIKQLKVMLVYYSIYAKNL